MPDLRHGIGAKGCRRTTGTGRLRAAFHAVALLDERGLEHSLVGCFYVDHAREAATGMARMVAIFVGDARGGLGRVAFLPAWLGFAGEPPPEHVYLDRDGHGRCLLLQHGRRTLARDPA